MRAILPTVLVALLLGGCIVHTRGTPRGRASARSRDCPPAYHWDGGACVHNGKHKGHHKR
jgi:hypothetical protein